MNMLFKFIPKSVKAKLIRRLASSKNLEKLDDVTIKVADTFNEFKSAAELLHDSYVGQNLMEPHPSKMRCNIHTFLPHTTAIVAINKAGKVVGTLSIIQDTQLGIPADSEYAKDLNEIRRKKNREIIEISALSIAPEYRNKSHSLQFALLKYLYIYCRDFLNINTFVMVVAPKAELFYNSLLLFQPKGKIVSYGYVKGALGRLLYLDFSGNFEQYIWSVYKRRANSLMHYILFQNDERLIFNPLKKDVVETRSRDISLSLIKASSFELSHLTKLELSYLISSLNLRNEDLFELGLKSAEVSYEYRFKKKIMAKGQIEDSSYIFKITNLSAHGAFLETSNLLLKEPDSIGKIIFPWRGQEVSTFFKVQWINDGISNKLPTGIGIKFVDFELNFFDEDINYQRSNNVA